MEPLEALQEEEFVESAYTSAALSMATALNEW